MTRIRPSVALLHGALSLISPPLCWACGGDASRTQPLCRGCRAELRWLGAEPVDFGGVETWAPVSYEGPVRALVAGLNFRGAAGLANPMAAQIVAGALPHLLGPRKVLVPVPLHAARARRRGFNQAERLAGAVARRTGLELRDCLRRRGAATARQVGRGRAERLGGVERLVAARPGGCPAEAVLVDDVVTTGATLRACAAALKAAGTRSVGALAYARTPGR